MAISNGLIELFEVGNTTRGALANVYSDIRYNGTLNVTECRSIGEWDTTLCELIG
jgi:hypothetical protein